MYEMSLDKVLFVAAKLTLFLDIRMNATQRKFKKLIIWKKYVHVPFFK